MLKIIVYPLLLHPILLHIVRNIKMIPCYSFFLQRPSPDIKQSLYRLVHELIMNNWRYFFKGSVLKTLHSQSPQNGNGDVQNAQQFTAIMQVCSTLTSEVCWPQFITQNYCMYIQILSYLLHDKWIDIGRQNGKQKSYSLFDVSMMTIHMFFCIFIKKNPLIWWFKL